MPLGDSANMDSTRIRFMRTATILFVLIVAGFTPMVTATNESIVLLDEPTQKKSVTET